MTVRLLRYEGAAKAAYVKTAAFRFVLAFGFISLFADFTYEGSRSIVGPYLAHLGANGFIVGIVAGLGEFLCYALRLVSGRMAERTGYFWPITLFGYFIQMVSVPLLALANSWEAAAFLVIIERIGKATRNPPRDVMLSHAGNLIGFGWVFGVDEALDQFGAMIGPLAVAAVLIHQGDYAMSFAMLAIPALVTIVLLILTRVMYPNPEQMEPKTPEVKDYHFPRGFWTYLTGASFAAAGFTDFSLMSFHFGKTHVLPPVWIPIFYAIAMGVSGLGSLIFGKLFDRKGIVILIPLTAVTAIFAPLVFLGGFWLVLLGCILWGIGSGVHESIIPAAVTAPVERRASAYGVFTAGYGIAWFVGSAISGFLYDVSLNGMIAFSVIAELAALPFLFRLRHEQLRKEKA